MFIQDSLQTIMITISADDVFKLVATLHGHKDVKCNDIRPKIIPFVTS